MGSSFEASNPDKKSLSILVSHRHCRVKWQIRNYWPCLEEIEVEIELTCLLNIQTYDQAKLYIKSVRVISMSSVESAGKASHRVCYTRLTLFRFRQLVRLCFLSGIGQAYFYYRHLLLLSGQDSTNICSMLLHDRIPT